MAFRCAVDLHPRHKRTTLKQKPAALRASCGDSKHAWPRPLRADDLTNTHVAYCVIYGVAEREGVVG